MSTRVQVIGLGYVGLPLLQACLKSEMQVVGFDLDQGRLVELENLLKEHVISGRLRLTSTTAGLPQPDVIVVCVPTPLDRNRRPDYSYVAAAATQLASQVGRKTLVILESSVGPGTTEGLFRQVIESHTKLRAGIDFHLAYSPERIDPANHHFVLENTPKIVGGLTQLCAQEATLFYKKFVNEVVTAAGLREAEAAKILENTYRHVNIALINQFSDVCRRLGIDTSNVIEMAATKPFGFQAFFPSAGAGGHCIPVDPIYLAQIASEKLKMNMSLVTAANEINDARPNSIAREIFDFLSANIGSKSVFECQVLLLGVSYKPNVGDFRESKQLDLLRELQSLGPRILFHDAHMEENQTSATKVEDGDLEAKILESDAVVLTQGHKEYLLSKALAHSREKLINLTQLAVPSAWRL